MNQPTHSFNHPPELVLIYGVEVENMPVFPQKLLPSYHSLITFKCIIMNSSTFRTQSYYSKCLSVDAVAKFKETISVLISRPPGVCPELSHYKISPAVVDSIAVSHLILKKTRKKVVLL